MDESLPPHPPSTSAPRAARANSPHLNVITASPHGLVMEAGREFEVGATVALGFHLKRKDRSSRFISAEMVVVDSTPRYSDRGTLVHRITMVFSEISLKDRRLLTKLSERDALKASQEAPREPVSPNEKLLELLTPKPPVSRYGFSLN